MDAMVQAKRSLVRRKRCTDKRLDMSVHDLLSACGTKRVVLAMCLVGWPPCLRPVDLVSDGESRDKVAFLAWTPDILTLRANRLKLRMARQRDGYHDRKRNLNRDWRMKLYCR